MATHILFFKKCQVLCDILLLGMVSDKTWREVSGVHHSDGEAKCCPRGLNGNSYTSKLSPGKKKVRLASLSLQTRAEHKAVIKIPKTSTVFYSNCSNHELQTMPWFLMHLQKDTADQEINLISWVKLSTKRFDFCIKNYMRQSLFVSM